jgi:hypothetical protein
MNGRLAPKEASVDHKVLVNWDAEKQVFFVVESELAGLWAEASSMRELIEIIEDVAPDLLVKTRRIPDRAESEF